MTVSTFVKAMLPQPGSQTTATFLVASAQSPWWKHWDLLDSPFSLSSRSSELPLLSASTTPVTQLDEFLLNFRSCSSSWDSGIRESACFWDRPASVLEIKWWSALKANELSKEMWSPSSGLCVLMQSKSLFPLVFSLRGFLCLRGPWTVAPRPAASALPGNRLEMQIFKSRPKLTEPEADSGWGLEICVWRPLHLVLTLIQVWEALLCLSAQLFLTIHLHRSPGQSQGLHTRALS